MINKIKRFLFDKEIRMGYLIKMGWYNIVPDKVFLKKKFKMMMGYELDLDKPKTYNEKLQWIKLYDRNPQYTIFVDKYKVRQYIKDIIGEEYLIPLIGVWDNADDIDFNSLPNRFVLKCNHNSGLGMCICKNKEEIDVDKVRKELKRGMKQNYYLSSREWPYKNVPRKIICEQYMSDDSDDELTDYKFYCFNGKMKFVGIYSDRNKDVPTKVDYFDRDFNFLDFFWGYVHADVKPSKPEMFEEMVRIAEKLSEGLPEIRVDLYQCGNQIYFGELTLFDGAGFDKIEPFEWDKKLGDWINIPIEK